MSKRPDPAAPPPPVPTAVVVPSGEELPRITTEVPGPRAAALCDLLAAVECPALTARRARRAEQSGAAHDPIVWAAARGANVADVDGNVYVDLTAGFGAALIGHGHPAVVAAVQAQAGRLLHALGDVYPSEPKITLEKRLTELAPWPSARVILGLSGSDAVEAALKTAVLATGRPGVLAFEGGYHGLSYGPLAACGYREAFRAPFRGQLGAHVAFAPYPGRGPGNDPARAVAAARAALSGGAIGAVLIEPILGRGGVVTADHDALAAIIASARAAGALVIADEIYTGMRRTDPTRWFKSETWPERPDIVCAGKALGGTLPVSACLMRAEVARHWGDPGGEAIHTSTFLGNPLACAAALAALDVLAQPATQQTLARAAERLWNHVLGPLLGEPSLGVRGLGGAGLLIGIQLEGGGRRALAAMRALLERGFVVLPGGAGGDRLTLTPPCTLTDAQADAFGAALTDVLRALPTP